MMDSHGAKEVHCGYNLQIMGLGDFFFFGSVPFLNSCSHSSKMHIASACSKCAAKPSPNTLGAVLSPSIDGAIYVLNGWAIMIPFGPIQFQCHCLMRFHYKDGAVTTE